MKFHLFELAPQNLENVLISSGFENDPFFFCLEETNEHMQIYFAELEFYIIKYTI